MTTPTGPGAPNRLPLMLAIGAGLLILVFVATQVLGGDDDADDTTTTTLATTTLAPPVATTVPPVAPPAETFESFTTKNPFVPLRIVGGGGGATGGAATTGGGTTGAGGTAPASAPGGPGAAPSGGTTATQGRSGAQPAARPSGAGRPATEPRRGARVALLDVFVEGGRVVANVRVNDTVHKVGEGQVFATSFKVVSLSQADGCGRFVFGDDAFRLCKGEETLK